MLARWGLVLTVAAWRGTDGCVGGWCRSFFSRHTAEVAKETLQNEALQIQTRELSAAVVQYILNGRSVGQSMIHGPH